MHGATGERITHLDRVRHTVDRHGVCHGVGGCGTKVDTALLLDCGASGDLRRGARTDHGIGHSAIARVGHLGTGHIEANVLGLGQQGQAAGRRVFGHGDLGAGVRLGRGGSRNAGIHGSVFANLDQAGQFGQNRVPGGAHTILPDGHGIVSRAHANGKAITIGEAEIVGGDALVGKNNFALLDRRFACSHQRHARVTRQGAAGCRVNTIHSERHVVGHARQGELGAAHSDCELAIRLDLRFEHIQHTLVAARANPGAGNGDADGRGGDVGRCSGQVQAGGQAVEHVLGRAAADRRKVTCGVTHRDGVNITSGNRQTGQIKHPRQAHASRGCRDVGEPQTVRRVGQRHASLVGDGQTDGVLRTQPRAGECQTQVGTRADSIGLAVQHHRVAHIGRHSARKTDVCHLLLRAAGPCRGGNGLCTQAGQRRDGRTIDHKGGVVGVGHQRQTAGGLVGRLHHQGVAGIGTGQGHAGRGCTRSKPEHVSIDTGGVFGRELGGQISSQAAGALAARHTGFGREAG